MTLLNTPLPFDLERDIAAYPPTEKVWQPTPENILDVADYAVRTVLRSPIYTPEDREDATQVAALRVWSVSQQRGDKGRAYYYVVARYAILDWLRGKRETPVECRLEPLEWMLSSTIPKDDAPSLDVERIRNYGSFTDQEITYLYYRIRGLSNAGIARLMGTRESTVRHYRRKLLPRLQHLAGESSITSVNRGRLADETCRQIERWRAIEMPWEEIARRLKRHRKALCSSLRRWREREMQKAIA